MLQRLPAFPTQRLEPPEGRGEISDQLLQRVAPLDMREFMEQHGFAADGAPASAGFGKYNPGPQDSDC